MTESFPVYPLFKVVLQLDIKFFSYNINNQITGFYAFNNIVLLKTK